MTWEHVVALPLLILCVGIAVGVGSWGRSLLVDAETRRDREYDLTNTGEDKDC